jgi:amidase
MVDNNENQIVPKNLITDQSMDRRPYLKGLGLIGVGSIIGSQSVKADSSDEYCNVRELTVEKIHNGIESGSITATSLVNQYLRRIDAYDDELNSIITINPEACERAEELDAQFEESGFTGPLHGIPIILKDNNDTQDMPTTAGSKALADSIPPRDAFIVEQLRKAGGVILAKANLHEFSYGVDTVSSLGGETRNAYAVDHRPSGSSGGTAAAIAANFAAIGTGTDTCSSNRSPPAFNNLVGLRPTVGLVSRTGIVPLSATKDTAGPITRTVSDAARMMDVMIGYDPEDPVTAEGAQNIPEEGYISHLNSKGLEGARIGVVRQLFGLQDQESASEDDANRVTELIETAMDTMEQSGATIVDPVEIIDVDTLSEGRVTEHEFQRDVNNYLAELGDAAPYDTLEEIVESGDVEPEVRDRIVEMGTLDIDVDTLDENVEYLQKLKLQEEIRRDTLSRMEDKSLDALLYPPSTVPPVQIPDNQPFDELPCELSAHSGLPAIVVPAGFTDDGLPVGLELLGRRFDESRLFELAYSYEQATQHRQPPSGFGPLES